MFYEENRNVAKILSMSWGETLLDSVETSRPGLQSFFGLIHTPLSTFASQHQDWDSHLSKIPNLSSEQTIECSPKVSDLSCGNFFPKNYLDAETHRTKISKNIFCTIVSKTAYPRFFRFKQISVINLALYLWFDGTTCTTRLVNICWHII